MCNYLLMRFTIISYSNIKEKYSCLENLKVRHASADEKIPVSDPTFQKVTENGLQLQTRETSGQMRTKIFSVKPENMRSSFAITYTLPILFLSARLVICLNSTSSRNQTQAHSYDTNTSSIYKWFIPVHLKTKSGINTARHNQKIIVTNPVPATCAEENPTQTKTFKKIHFTTCRTFIFLSHFAAFFKASPSDRFIANTLNPILMLPTIYKPPCKHYFSPL